MNKSNQQKIYEFEAFRLDAAHRMLYRGDEEIRLAPKAIETLLALIENRGSILSKDELMDRIWTDSVVEESNLAQYLHLLRKTLGETASGRPFIETFRRRGYRFNGEVKVSESAVETQSANRNENFVVPPTVTDEITPSMASQPIRDLQWPAEKRGGFSFFGAVVFGLLILGAFVFALTAFRSEKPAVNAPVKSIAALPLLNESGSPEMEYLSDGLADSIINNLSQISDLKVVSRNSAFRFRQNQTDTKLIAARLGVQALVTGDIRQIGDKFVINVRLIDGRDDSQIWGQQFVKTNADIIAAQNEIAQAVATNLHLKLTGVEQQQLAKRYTENVEAYQLYLKGRYHIFKLTPPEIQKGISYFRQAIEIDPNYALAYTGLSDAYRAIALSGATPSAEIMPLAKAAAQKALEIDDRLAEAHTSLSSIIFWHDWDWTAAENQLKRALEINPNNADARIFYAYLLSNTGRHAESLMEAKRARELDPLSLVFNALEGQFLLHAGQTDEALDRLQKTFELDSNFGLAYSFASSLYTQQGKYEAAIAQARKAKELNGVSSQPVALLCYALVKSGKRSEARNELEKLLNLSKERYISPYDTALIFNAFGEHDETFAYLERGFEQRDPRMTFLKVEPKWNNLRSEPRFVSLLKRMNFE